ncbi:isoprenylcysteine carboxylmethyltransferase family protein [bacterium]|nr:isoprenylcysteine carboxylmethyltransferase family protein [bacterium]
MKWIVLGLLVSGFFLAFLLLPAGRADWPAAYASVALLVSGWVLAAWRLQTTNPVLFARRAEYGEGTPNWDRWLVLVLKLSVLAVFILAGLDSGRVARLPEWWCGLLGVVLYSIGLQIFMASQKANPFFEGMVRHQTEFGHRVVDRGPYARLRHPGYLGFLLVFASIPCLLGSGWAAWGLLPVLACFVTRIVLEEVFLCEHLPGYKEYRERVCYRLIPGLW